MASFKTLITDLQLTGRNSDLHHPQIDFFCTIFLKRSAMSNRTVECKISQSVYRYQDYHHLKVVALETLYCAIPALDLPHPYTYELFQYEMTREDQVLERIQCADILILSSVRLSGNLLSKDACPSLKMISIAASGTNMVDRAACKLRGIHVAHSPNCNDVAVSEHAIGLYFTLRRSIVPSNSFVRVGNWSALPHPKSVLPILQSPNRMPPMICSQEVMGIIGYGAIGRTLATKARALGMRVLVAARKDGANTTCNDSHRTAFTTVLKESSIIVLCVPLLPGTKNLISTPELVAMPPHALLINVSRGGVVNEAALVAALENKTILGAATDVCSIEPADSRNNVLLRPHTAGLNLIVTPHMGWYAGETQQNFRRYLQNNIKSWLCGKPVNTAF